MEQTSHSKSFLRIAGIASVVVLALVIIVASVFTLLNPDGIETDNTSDGAIVVLSDSGVTPETIKLKQGESVMWNNDGATPRHLIITSSDPEQELVGFGNTEAILEGESYSFLFDTQGTFTYEDTTNPDVINGTIVVE
jgi:plastocyanin